MNKYDRCLHNLILKTGTEQVMLQRNAFLIGFLLLCYIWKG